MRHNFCALVFLCSFILLAATGCSNDKFLDPTQIGRFRPVPAVNLILDSLGIAEETTASWETGEEPKPADVVAYETDYTFGPGDIVLINIFELFNEGMMYSNQFVVTETGRISIPDVGVVEASGLTESQLEEEIKQILSPNLLKNPSVNVVLMQSQSRMFSILGTGVPKPGRYPLPRYDFRLADALATAGGISQFNISYVYVSRPITGKESLAEPVPGRVEVAPVAEPPAAPSPKPALRTENEQAPAVESPASKPSREQDELFEVIAPIARAGHSVRPGEMTGRNDTGNEYVVSSAEMATDEEIAEAASPEDKDTANEQLVPKDASEDTNAVVERQTAAEPADTNAIELRTTAADKDHIPSSVNLASPAEPGYSSAGAMKSNPVEPDQGKNARIEWVFQDGRWVPVQIGQPATQPGPAAPESGPAAGKPSPGPAEGVSKPAEPPAETPAGWEQIGMGGMQRRIIRIPADKLVGGEPRYNIVIWPGDNINVPVDIIGEFCIMGNVNNQGFINITGRPMTLKMAIAAAGGLGPLAWPKRCEVVRRVSKKREEIVMVDLDKIAMGEQPDFFIKPNDLINVGTHPTARWRAVLRNAFGASYGFGFTYDRNFAYPARFYGTNSPFGAFGF
jgi:polysaccharide export outer membrane protein